MKFTTAIAFAAYALPSVLCAVAKLPISDHFASLSSQAKIFSASIKNFPASGGTLKQAQVIHNEAILLIAGLQNATTLVPPDFSRDDAQAVFGNVQAFQPLFLDAVNALISKKPALHSAGILGQSFLQDDIQQLATASAALGTGLLSAAHPDFIVAGRDVCIAANHTLSGLATAFKN